MFSGKTEGRYGSDAALRTLSACYRAKPQGSPSEVMNITEAPLSPVKKDASPPVHRKARRDP